MPSTARPIFIIGSMGSGSTLMRLILDSHEHIAIPQETGFMRAYNAHRFIPFKHSGRGWATRMGWTRKELDHELALFYERIFTRLVERQGKIRWGDKTPLHTWHVDAMLRMFPQATFIAMMRHPGGAVASNMNRFGHGYTRASRGVMRYDREIARQSARHSDRFAIVRYEELVLRPEPLLRELLDWLGEPWSDNVLAHHEVQTARGGDQLVVEGTNRIDDPIDISRIDKWHRTMTGAQKEAVARDFRRLGAFFGYDASDPTVLAPLGGDDRLLIGGARIAARIDAFPDLDLHAPNEAGLQERPYQPWTVGLHGKGKLAYLNTPPPEPPLSVRLWRVIPRDTRIRLRPVARVGKRWRRRLRRLRRR